MPDETEYSKPCPDCSGRGWIKGALGRPLRSPCATCNDIGLLPVPGGGIVMPMAAMGSAGAEMAEHVLGKEIDRLREENERLRADVKRGAQFVQKYQDESERFNKVTAETEDLLRRAQVYLSHVSWDHRKGVRALRQEIAERLAEPVPERAGAPGGENG